jgi:UDP-N-acetyl-D-glucosamine dehydrogenase
VITDTSNAGFQGRRDSGGIEMTTLQDAGRSLQTIDRIQSRTAIVGVIGLGYVGLPMAVASAEAGFATIGFDLDTSRVADIRRGISPIGDMAGGRLAAVLTPTPSDNAGPPRATGGLTATTDLDRLGETDLVIVCVPTPLTQSKDPDLTFVIAAADAIASAWHPGMLVSIESTSFPGTTEEIVLPRLERANAPDSRRPPAVGTDFFLAFSPERIDPGRTDWTLRTTPKVIGGVTPTCLEVATAFYQTIVDRVVPVSTPRSAEMVKILENTFRAVNVALANEMAVICHELDIDIWEVIEAAKTKPFGYTPFYPGPGLGGHCIPIDPLYLSFKLRTLKLPARTIQLADELNGVMPGYVVSRVGDLLDWRGITLHGSRLLLLGVSYKPNVSDTRESPAIEVFERFERHGAEVSFHDPFVRHLEVGGIPRERIEIEPSTIAGFDCVVILTNHAGYDWQAIVDSARMVFDTRNATGGLRGPDGKVVRL